MSRSTRARAGSILPAGLLGMVLLVASGEALVASRALDLTRFYIIDWKVAAQAARSEASACGVLCLGDSLVKFGLQPEGLEARLKTPAYNLAVCDGQAASTYFLFRRALDAGARPKAVVVDFVPHLLAVDPRHNLRNWPEMIDVRELIDLGYFTHHAGFFAQLILGRMLPSFKDRDEIRGNVVQSLHGCAPSHRDDVLAHCRDWAAHRGAEASPDRPSYAGEIDAKNPAYFPRRWVCHPVNEAYIRRFLALAAAYRVDVLWLLPPVVPKFAQRRHELGLDASYARWIRALLRDYPGVLVVDGQHSGYDHSLFIDPLHLNTRGARRLTEAVAWVQADRHHGDRWVVLPAFDTAGKAVRAREIGHMPTQFRRASGN